MDYKGLFEQVDPNEVFRGSLNLPTKRKPIVINWEDPLNISMQNLFWAVACYGFDRLKLTDKGKEFFAKNDPGQPPKYGCNCGGQRGSVPVVELALKNEDIKPKPKTRKNG